MALRTALFTFLIIILNTLMNISNSILQHSQYYSTAEKIKIIGHIADKGDYISYFRDEIYRDPFLSLPFSSLPYADNFMAGY